METTTKGPHEFYVFLNDGETFSPLAGCLIATEAEDGSVRTFDLATLLKSIQPADLINRSEIPPPDTILDNLRDCDPGEGE